MLEGLDRFPRTESLHHPLRLARRPAENGVFAKHGNGGIGLNQESTSVETQIGK